MGSTCPSLVEAGLAPVPVERPQVVDVFDEESALRELRQMRRQKRERELAAAAADEAFERAVFFNRLGFGLGAASAYFVGIGAFAGAAALKSSHTRGCKSTAAIFGDWGVTAADCPSDIPGYGLAITMGVGFTLAGLVFTIMAANSPTRIARRMGRISFGPRGVGLTF